ncbi:hypothetical protein [Sphingomonas koreensis]
MDDEQWLAALRVLAQTQSKLADGAYRPVRAALAACYAQLSAAPAKSAELYARIAETELVRAANAQFSRLEDGDWRWDFAGAGLEDGVAALGARVRALDRLLKHLTNDHGPPADIELDYLCTETGWFVIPRLTARIARDGHGGRATIQQRATLDHRLLPRKLGSYTIELAWLGDIVTTAPGKLGAAMFEDFELEIQRSGEPLNFIATGILCPTAETTITTAVARAAADGCSALAWPELTMRPQIELKALREALEAAALSDAAGDAPGFTLAGSWHVEGKDGRRNIAPVLDSCGREILRHAKSRAYADNEYGMEAILCDYRIPVLVTQEELVAFAICKDFCDARPGIPYPLLDIDLIIVGSIGNDVTMQSHRSAASDAMALGTRTFVVQQDLSTTNGETGWVLPPSRAPGQFDLKKLRTPAWSVWPAK